MTFKFKTTVRHALGYSPPGMCVGISDFAAQELRCIACIANISKMLEAFFSEEQQPFLIRPDTGKEYLNPKSDLHTFTSTYLYPELRDVSPWDLIKEAKKDCGGWNRRQRAKICNFTVVYGGSANRISSALQIDVSTAESLLNVYFKAYPELKSYLHNTGIKAKHQGWVHCSVTGRRYWVREDNSKGLGDDNTVMRKAQNSLIQGLSSVMTKLAMFYVDQSFEELNLKYSSDLSSDTYGRLVAVIHDKF